MGLGIAQKHIWEFLHNQITQTLNWNKNTRYMVIINKHALFGLDGGSEGFGAMIGSRVRE